MSRNALAVHSNTDDIVVEASSDGFPSVQVTIPVSTDPSTASVLAVAEASAAKPVDFFAADK